MAIILASQSPRRRQLLAQMGLGFQEVCPQTDEQMDPCAPPEEEVARICRKKALAVKPLIKREDIVIAADTIVVIGTQVLGKPRDSADAERMLRLLSGREHRVLTGLTVLQGEKIITQVETARIQFRPMEEAEIRAYVQTQEPLDKAGAYGIQGLGAVFVQSITGDYYSVMGLPVCRLSQILRQWGYPVL